MRGEARPVAALIGVALFIAGCGSSSSSTASSSSGSRGPARAAVISTTKGKDGTYLAGAGGRALYLWLGDDNGKSNCSGDCDMSWPPVTTNGAPTPSGAVTASGLGTITRSDGTKQVTYKGHPLYYFVVDSGPGTTKGQGSDSFGARWWLVAPSGAAITVNGSSSVSPPISY